MLVFDIETGPRPLDELLAIIPPFDPATVDVPRGEFDPSSVKFGTLKDEAKRQAKVDEARAAFEAAKADAPRIVAQAEANYWRDQVAKAALSPILGRVLAIGYLGTENGRWVIEDVANPKKPTSEAELLAGMWRKYEACRKANRSKVGFNICGFDLPFMIRRSWYLGVEVPSTVLDPSGRYFDRLYIDLLARWKCGNYGDSIKLDAMAKFFGVGGKPDGVSGADFARLLWDDRPRAIEYLINDLHMTAGCAARMGYV